MTVAYGGICCANPPCVNVCLRKATYSYGNIMEKKAFTINISSEKYAKEVDYFGMASGREVNKFIKTGLTPVKSDLVDAPYVAEFSVIIECKVIHSYEIGLHTLFVGEVMDVKADEEVLDGKTGLPSLENIKPLVFDIGTRSYHSVGSSLGRAYNIGKELLK